MSSNPAHDGVYLVLHYVIKFVSDLRQVCGFLSVLWFPPPINWPTRYNSNIVGSGVKQRNPYHIYNNTFKWNAVQLIGSNRTHLSPLRRSSNEYLVIEKCHVYCTLQMSNMLAAAIVWFKLCKTIDWLLFSTSNEQWLC